MDLAAFYGYNYKRITLLNDQVTNSFNDIGNNTIHQTQNYINIVKEHYSALNNNISYENNILRLSERLGPCINPNEHMEINPYIGYETYRGQNTISNAQISTIRTTSLNMESKFYFFSKWQSGASVNKNFIQGVSANVSRNPLVINCYFQMDCFKNRQGSIKFEAFDLLRQNNFIQRQISNNAYTDSRTNALSRYFMLSINVNLQRWTEITHKGGKSLKEEMMAVFCRNDTFLNASLSPIIKYS